MKHLLEGLQRYERAAKAQYAEQFATLAKGQKPKTLFVTCSDSRVVPNLLAAADPGQLFVVRNVANLVPRADATGDPSVAAATSYAVNVLGVQDIVICGHSSCGGANAMISGGTGDPFIDRWLEHGSSAVAHWKEHGPLDATKNEGDQLSQTSAHFQLQNLLSYPFVRERVEAGELRLHAWWFDIAEALLLAYSTPDSRFIPAVEALERWLEKPQRSVA